jgi:hypothetical protein
MKICIACNSHEVFDPESDYCRDCEEEMQAAYEEQLEYEMENTFKENAETESGTIVRNFQEIFELIKERITELVDDLELSLEEDLSISNINIYEFRYEPHDKLLETTYKNNKLVLEYKTFGIYDSPSDLVDYFLEFLINGESEFSHRLTYTNGEYELCDCSYMAITQDGLDSDDEENFIDNIINKLKEL